LKFLGDGFNVVVVHYATEGLAAYDVDNKDELPQNPVTIFPESVVELAEAVAFLRTNLDKYPVDKDNITVMGFSAGGTVAAQLGVFWNKHWLSEKLDKSNELLKPNQLMLGYAALDLNMKSTRPLPLSMQKHKKDFEFNAVKYAVTGKLNPSDEEVDKISPMKNISGDVPPTFLWHTQEDPLVPVLNSIEFAAELERNGVPVELHIFTHGKHGLGLGDYRTGVKKNQTSAQVYKWVNLFEEWMYPNKTKRGSLL
jgi:Esterase/lipase